MKESINCIIPWQMCTCLALIPLPVHDNVQQLLLVFEVYLLSALLLAASLLALSGIYRYTDAKRDHQEALLYKHDNNFKQIRESRIK
jgi:hypothetical protein